MLRSGIFFSIALAGGTAAVRLSPRMAAAAAAAPIRITPQEHSVALVALGCPKNTVDAEVMLGDLQRHGLRVVREPENADIVVINTCAFVEDAKRESVAAIVEAARLKADRSSRVRGLYVTGCMAQRYAEELADELPEVDAVVGFESYADIPSHILATLSTSDDTDTEHGLDSAAERASVLVGAATVPFRPENDRFQLTAAHTAYLRVAEGCDHACSFCAIPGFRGAFRSKPFDTALAEATLLVERGVREINLIAEDTNQFGSDWGEEDPRRLSHFLRELSALPGLRWIRLLYCYPSYFSDDLVAEIATNPKVVKYIDIPLQHLAAPTLQRMRRPGAKATISLLERLRREIPSLVLRTTFICGFPGESDDDHDELVRQARRLGFERGGAFSYSAEDGTPAARMAGQVEEETKQARKDELVALFQEASAAWAEARVGSELRVMVDRMDGLDAVGRTEHDAPDIDGAVRIPAMPLPPGSEVLVRVLYADVDGELVGEVVGSPPQ